MREIKFRGMDLNGTWHFGLLSIVKQGPDQGHYISNRAGTPLAYNVRPDSIGQCTGLKDSNRKEIYEGDILRGADYPFFSDGNENYRAVIEWDDDCPSFFSYPSACSSRVRGGAVGDYVFDDGQESAKHFEIIGNIYVGKKR